MAEVTAEAKATEAINLPELTEELRKLVTLKRVVLGTSVVKKALLAKELERILITTNCPDLLAREFKQLAKLSGTAVLEPAITSDRLGAVVKKPFSALVLGIKKA